MFSYSALKSYGKATLPSVESWSIGGNPEILRDPPKSLTIPKKDKVGDLNDIRETMNTYTKDRLYQNEVIKVFPRGVNPMGGTRIQNTDGGTQASLPIKVTNQGAVRFNLKAPVDNLPLSRAARSDYSLKINSDLSKIGTERVCPDARNSKAINRAYTHTKINPSAVYSIDKIYDRNFEVKRVIENPFHADAFSSNNFERAENVKFDRIKSGVNTQYKQKMAAPITRGDHKQSYEGDTSMKHNVLKDAIKVNVNVFKKLDNGQYVGVQESDKIVGHFKNNPQGKAVLNKFSVVL
jgi:hypothetical protein